MSVHLHTVVEGTMLLYVLAILIVVVTIYAIATYNRLILLKNSIKKAWANIDVLLKQRHDELPKLVAVCREYMRHEQETLERVVAARSRVNDARVSGNVQALATAEGLLRSGLGQLFALVESYPELKANENFQHLQARITSIENALADRREFYNETVNNNNVAIDVFPDVLIARWFNFRPARMLEFGRGELADVDVGHLFRSNA
jgi:LemA protein